MTKKKTPPVKRARTKTPHATIPEATRRAKGQSRVILRLSDDVAKGLARIALGGESPQAALRRLIRAEVDYLEP